MAASQGEDGDAAVKQSAKAIGTTTREAPLEQPSTSWARRLILFAFWTVVVAFGLPHWVWTTSIHRSELPLRSMNAWADGEACQIHYPIKVKVAGIEGQHAHARALAKDLASILETQAKSPYMGFDITTEDVTEPALIVKVERETGAKSMYTTLGAWAPTMTVTYDSDDAQSLALFTATQINTLFKAERDALVYATEGSPYAKPQHYEVHPAARADLDAKAVRAFRHASNYHLTFSLFAAGATPSTWAIERALAEYIQPLLDRMSSISDFTVDTQVQLFASSSPSIAGPHCDEVTREWKLERTDLSGFINAAEWPLSPGIGAGPTINFVLYVPSASQSPLVIAETGGNSWLIPQWGGVQIFNPVGKQDAELTIDDLRPVMLTFAEQLSSLLGVPATPSSVALRLGSMTRERAVSLIISSSSTLGALARLSLKLEHIAIPDSVAKSVDEAIHRLELACHNLREGRYLSALDNARVAEKEAEQAFFEPSMVGQVYFPKEHMVAVYVPLLGPMAVPLVMAVLKEVKKLRNRKKAKTA